MAASTVPKTKRDGKIEIITAEHVFELQFEPGDLAISNLKEGQTATTMILDRGSFHALRKTDFEPVSLAFTATLTDLSDNTDVLLVNACLGDGAWASDTSAFGANADCWGVKITFTIDGTSHGDAANHTMEFTPVRITGMDISEGEPSTVSVTAECYAAPVMT